ncbi:HAD family hydrolase [Flexivirga caeni]|uniref:HAD family hydrolase n=1 Tax=Flexivirga caeni TaxID=2294115 RepID=A0A3M9MCH8_9MICO|nr:HAD family hydrolase [Flexivirga caeni]RNI23246.1 HAD family hydrolase [Flexivirga caeni]
MRRSESLAPPGGFRLPVRAVLLDVDNTLLDNTTAMLAAGLAAMAALWPQFTAEQHVAMAERYRLDPGGAFERYMRGDNDYRVMRAERLRDVAAAYGVPVPDDALEIYESAFRPVFAQEQRTFEDVIPFAERCAEAGLRVAVLTNSSDELTAEKFERTGLTGRLGSITTRDTLGFGKPDPRVFRHACAGLGVEPGDTAYIGDEWAADVEGSRAAGLQPIWITRGGRAAAPEADPVPVIASLDQLRVGERGLEVLDLGRAAPTG